MSTTDPANATSSAAVGAQVDRGVRPHCWLYSNETGVLVVHLYDDTAKFAADKEAAEKWPAAHSLTALYDQAALDAAVAAERERIARVFDARDRGAGGFYDPHEPAEIIRALGPNCEDMAP